MKQVRQGIRYLIKEMEADISDDRADYKARHAAAAALVELEKTALKENPTDKVVKDRLASRGNIQC